VRDDVRLLEQASGVLLESVPAALLVGEASRERGPFGQRRRPGGNARGEVREGQDVNAAMLVRSFLVFVIPGFGFSRLVGAVLSTRRRGRL